MFYNLVIKIRGLNNDFLLLIIVNGRLFIWLYYNWLKMCKIIYRFKNEGIKWFFSVICMLYFICLFNIKIKYYLNNFNYVILSWNE